MAADTRESGEAWYTVANSLDSPSCQYASRPELHRQAAGPRRRRQVALDPFLICLPPLALISYLISAGIRRRNARGLSHAGPQVKAWDPPTNPNDAALVFPPLSHRAVPLSLH